MKKIENSDEFNSVIDSENIVVIVFTVTWCPDCHFIQPFMDDLIKDFSNKISVYEVDTDQLTDIKSKYNVFGIPSFIAYKDGEVLNTFISKRRKSESEIREFFISLV